MEKLQKEVKIMEERVQENYDSSSIQVFPEVARFIRGKAKKSPSREKPVWGYHVWVERVR